ncbi:flagellar hook-associated protein FlgK [Halalkalibacterium ligniniphilum]|uniref:flagellar hook-associated protein FlgK n=1 Tax=Halalkalibacterium ligniniphilum TaxID=1134413 RepID=UPI000347800C|nr:flagellar hook-associated protein FlgK [Halalkalibacterium ligniniphilum]
MTSTFHGLETARRGMMTQQYALHTVGHNIANANTEGYTRQRVNFAQTEPYPAVGMNAPRLPGQLGTGVKAGSVQRVREHFLDVQYRNENNKYGYWSARSDAYLKMEDIMNEPSTNGLASQIDRFWAALQELSVEPEDAGARAVVKERGIFVAETFNYLSSSLHAIRNDYGNEIDVTVTGLNTLLTQLNDVNQEIRKAEPHGYVTNDLYDEQDRLLNEISKFIKIDTKRVDSPGQPNPAAEGAVTVTISGLVDSSGNPITLVDATNKDAVKQFSVKYDDNANPNHVQYMEIKDSTGASVSYTQGGTTMEGLPMSVFPSGELKALVEAYGHSVYDGTLTETGISGLYPDMLNTLDDMARQFATEVNNIHKIGFGLASPTDPNNIPSGNVFFDDTAPITAGNLKISAAINASLNNIAAASVNVDAFNDPAVKDRYLELIAKSPKSQAEYDEIYTILSNDSHFNGPKAFAGDGSGALRLSYAKETRLTFTSPLGGTSTGTISSYYQSVIGQMAVATNEASRNKGNAEILRDSVEFNRNSVSNVSLDEEMTLMIQFQHAYNAAARNITMVDEMLDRIINGMGVVGR